MQMDLEILLSEMGNWERNTYDITYMWNLKHVQTNVYVKQKQNNRHRKQTCGYQRERDMGRDKLGIRFQNLPYTKQISSKDMLE